MNVSDWKVPSQHALAWNFVIQPSQSLAQGQGRARHAHAFILNAECEAGNAAKPFVGRSQAMQTCNCDAALKSRGLMGRSATHIGSVHPDLFISYN